ncbi:hypothetical protein [uncultured Gammaproteobacteria bacterium]|jgi:DNA-binding transcriptional ArsR family regulator|uniref:ArsR/SmtB family transcription factor n=1 Tax=thiotrophic endosymbiont of Bathymodiolus puteoserpentis (Logatchev) TaxID=343240 RepID=UPI0010B07A74|nr:metalloregulator ArsR/SmtB family transcription factor [thiotrophic endosymbiont of Bathymodiolus puteoserpentis (Logatchev)]CAC9426100.1 hypothetical protein [uncultured Gammaproteobacteria bacterium]CAC9426153.1 hypothetical protein [uncultured Gammaproteobacteria bacterium]CAC9513175.1 hypothetical protein [uncultured Gammaproteobacteria bacterium]CAC9519513.1 hypothetical protein [uncultured Gammaproteobacteria bacterium]CAC9519528.1 hypothetical protein [uncultured Gammaproteobacteria 
MEFLEKNSDKVAKVLKAIASPVRLKILRALSDNSLSVANIQKQVGTSRSNIAQSLIILKKNEIVASYHDNNKILYKIKKAEILSFIASVEVVFCTKN